MPIGATRRRRGPEARSLVQGSWRDAVGVRVAEGQGRRAFDVRDRSVEGLPSAAAPAGLMLHRSVAVLVAVKGKVCDVHTNAATEGELLSAMGIEPSGNGRVAPPLGTPRSRAVSVRGDLIESRIGTVIEQVVLGGRAAS